VDPRPTVASARPYRRFARSVSWEATTMSNDIAQAEKDIDKAVLELLLHSQQWPWSVEEVGREVGDQLGAEDALSRLARAGLATVTTGSSFRAEQRSVRSSLTWRVDSCALSQATVLPQPSRTSCSSRQQRTRAQLRSDAPGGTSREPSEPELRGVELRLASDISSVRRCQTAAQVRDAHRFGCSSK
jgi:hypothetical protein